MTKIVQIFKLFEMADKLISHIPEGPLADKWTNHKAHIKVVSPANKRIPRPSGGAIRICEKGGKCS